MIKNFEKLVFLFANNKNLSSLNDKLVKETDATLSDEDISELMAVDDSDSEED